MSCTSWRPRAVGRGAAMLLAWAGGLGVAAALVCYAVAAATSVSLFVTGLVTALALWWGPGGSRFRGPLGRVVEPLSRRVGPWVVVVGLVLSGALVAGAVMIPFYAMSRREPALAAG